MPDLIPGQEFKDGQDSTGKHYKHVFLETEVSIGSQVLEEGQERM